jgi:transposase
MEKLTNHDLDDLFSSEEACLEWLKNRRWPDGIHCPKCNKVTNHYYTKSQKSYSCQACGHHIHPTANTIFHKSSTPLPLWFYTIYRLAQTEGKISAKQIQREIGVTYKTAARMKKLILEQFIKYDSFNRHPSQME